MLDESVINQAVQRLIAVVHCPVKVILFGSYARGDAGEGLDHKTGHPAWLPSHGP